MKHKWLKTLLLSLGCGVFSFVLFQFGVFESLELKTLDARFRQFVKPEQAAKDIVILTIDERSLQEFKRHGNPWPWQRDFYAEVVKYLQNGGAKLIMFDILFDNPDVQRLVEAEHTDGKFADAMKEANNVLLAINLRNEEILFAGDNKLERKSQFVVFPSEAIHWFPKYSNAVLPISLFQHSAAGFGVVNFFHDLEDGVCRRLPVLSLYNDAVFSQMGFSAFFTANAIARIEVLSRNLIKAADAEVPLDEKGQFLIYWYGKGGPGGTFQYFSLYDIIASSIAEKNKKTPSIPSTVFKDKYVFVGSNAAGLFDIQNTPFSRYAPYPGTEVHATVLSNLLQRDFLVRVSRHIPVIVMFLFSLAVCFSFLFTGKIRYPVAVALTASVGWLLYAAYLFQEQKDWLDVVAPEFSIFFSFTLAAVVSYQTEGKARRHLRSIFSRYISPVVVTEILKQRDQIELGGKETIGSVLFSDIKDFTVISEKKSPREIVNILNKYFSVAAEIIHRNQGMLDKYLGDAVMAIFGAPLTDRSHAVQACAAALELQCCLRRLWHSDGNHFPALMTRIGINSGTMVVGNIGSSLRLDYTAIGDTVNLASRLESVNKIYNTEIIIGEATYYEIKGEFVTRELDILCVKGKEKPVVVYELVGKQGEVEQKMLERIEQFHEGIKWYRERVFDKAVIVFRAILSSSPNDGPSQEYLRRCEAFLTSPPEPNWDGVFKLDVK